MDKNYLEVFGEFPGVKGFFSTKYGASEGSPYSREDVIREQGLEHAGIVWPRQVHKSHIEVITKKSEKPLRLADTDGLLTDAPQVLLTTVHADCIPVYLYDPIRRAIGLVHAGWRGTALGIGAKAARMMKKHFQSEPEQIKAYIGPGISSCCFETGPEVYEEFKAGWPFIDEFASARGEKYFIDLKGINKRQLRKAGLAEKNIQVSPHCTCCEPELFCSYRREGGTYMRMGAGLCLL